VIRWHRTAWRRSWTWKSRKRVPGCPRIDPALRELIHQLARETLAGCRADRRRTPSTRLRRQRTHRSPLSPACAMSTTVTELAHLPAQPRVRDLGGRPVHGADNHAPHGIRVGFHHMAAGASTTSTSRGIRRHSGSGDRSSQGRPGARSPGISFATTTAVTARTSFKALRASGSRRS